ncbi:Hypothetical protein D9617_4g001940 [Elsinoe fawcettii]|nr:Hypothetical protein D9617_4g001940 [Elsinoe fawcettii]
MKTAALIALTVFCGLASAAPPNRQGDRQGSNSRPIHARSCKNGATNCVGIPQSGPALSRPVQSPEVPQSGPLTQRDIIGDFDVSSGGLGSSILKPKKPAKVKREGKTGIKGDPSSTKPAKPPVKNSIGLAKPGAPSLPAPSTDSPPKRQPPSRRDFAGDTTQDEQLLRREIEARGPKALQETDTVPGPTTPTVSNAPKTTKTPTPKPTGTAAPPKPTATAKPTPKKPTPKQKGSPLDQLVDAAGNVVDGIINKRDGPKTMPTSGLPGSGLSSAVSVGPLRKRDELKKAHTGTPKLTTGLPVIGLPGALRLGVKDKRDEPKKIVRTGRPTLPVGLPGVDLPRGAGIGLAAAN